VSQDGSVKGCDSVAAQVAYHGGTSHGFIAVVHVVVAVWLVQPDAVTLADVEEDHVEESGVSTRGSSAPRQIKQQGYQSEASTILIPR
jgi:hypothetical protein